MYGYAITWEKCAKRTFFMLIIILVNTELVLLMCLFSHLLYHFFSYLIEKLTIFANFIWLNLGNSFSNCSTVVLVPVWQKYFLLSNTFQNEMKSDLPAALEISRIVHLPSLLINFLTFETFGLHVTITGWPDFAASVTDSMPVSKFFLYLRTFS